MGKGFVSYRLPHQKKIHQQSGVWKTTSQFQEVQGFCIHPFIQQHYHYLTESDPIFNASFELSDLDPSSRITHEGYLNMITNTITHIQSKPAEKIVMARTEIIPQAINITASFHQLLSQYPDAFCYQLFHPDFGFWMGATPETLIRSHPQEGYETMALAGTKPDDDAIHWTQKEEQEQAFVKNEIVDVLTKVLAKNVTVEDRTHKKAGKVVHLMNRILFDISDNQVGQLLQQLHPTSAVCGIPKTDAKKYIDHHEKIDRQLYAGFLGPVLNNNVDLFVNLRCMQVFRNGVQLYLGGGITKDSQPEKEWEETVLKSATIKNILVHES